MQADTRLRAAFANERNGLSALNLLPLLYQGLTQVSVESTHFMPVVNLD